MKFGNFKAFFKLEFKALFREPVTLFFMIVLPIVLTVVFGGAFGQEATQYGEEVLGIDTVVPVNIIFLLANVGLMGVPITIIELKDQEVLKRYSTYIGNQKVFRIIGRENMKLLKIIGKGIAWGCTLCVFIMLAGALIGGDEFLAMTTDRFVAQAIGTILIGLGFTVPSLIYDCEKFGRGLQTLIHMGTGFFIYFLVALNIGWIPVECGWKVTVVSVLIAVAFAFAVWFCYYLYNKKTAEKLNQQLRAMKE